MWEDNVKMDLTEVICEVVDCIHMLRVGYNGGVSCQVTKVCCPWRHAVDTIKCV
jgi:hypothetical protein